MNEQCECLFSGSGHCSRRDVVVSGVHRKCCQNGGVADIDALYEQLAAGPADDPLPHKAPHRRTSGRSDIGTKLLGIAQAQLGKLKCSSCRSRILGLNKHTADGLPLQRLPSIHSELVLKTRGVIKTSTPDQVVLGWINEAIGGDPLITMEMVQRQRRERVRRPRVATSAVNGDPVEVMPFMSDANLTLLMHFYPTDEQMVQWHLERLRKVEHLFHRKMVGIAYGPETMKPEDVLDQMPGWESIVVKNNKDLREVATYREMMPRVANQDPLGVTFCAHGKGAQSHTANEDAILWWADSMYKTVLFNVDGVLEAMDKGVTVVGSFRRTGRHLGCRYRYHFSGTFYAVRNALAFRSGRVPPFRNKWWGTESWPGDYFPYNHSHCIFGDNVDNLYNVNEQPRKELEEWEAEHGAVPS